ncbi:TPA: EamA family transporter [Legionella anisa]
MIIVWFISIEFLGEQISLFNIFGIFAVFFGLALTVKTFEAGHSRQIFFPFICGICIAGYHLCYGRSLAHGANPAALFAAALPGIFLLMNKKQRQILGEKIKISWKGMSFGGALSALSFLLFLLGLRYSEAGLSITLRNTSVVFAQIFAYWIGEKISSLQWSGHYSSL